MKKRNCISIDISKLTAGETLRFIELLKKVELKATKKTKLEILEAMMKY